MKFEVHWPEPSVLVCTPGWIGAVAAGAHAEAVAGSAKAAITAARRTRMRRVIELRTSGVLSGEAGAPKGDALCLDSQRRAFQNHPRRLVGFHKTN
jgi:hypothetical protein